MRSMLVAARLFGGAIVSLGLSSGAMAIEEVKDEKAVLKACEKSLCDLIAKKAPTDGDFACVLTKTWRKQELKEGSAQGKLSWGFGDAQCKVELKLARAQIVSAIKDPKSTLQFPDHSVSCVVDREKDQTKVVATLAPKAEFEAGKVKKVWVNLKSVDGPAVVKGLAFATAKLEDNVGVFHGSLVKAVNHLIQEKCPKLATAN